MKFLFVSLFCFSAFAQVEGVHHISFENDDLAPIDQMIKGAEIVAIGESGHGSSGYLKMRLKVIKHLVQTQGFRTILLENGYYQSEEFDQYLKQCSINQNNPANLLALVRKANIIYRSQEILDTFTWMCSYNKEHSTDPVSFHGMDIWETPWTDREVINRLVSEVDDQGLKAYFETAKENCWAWKANSWAEAATFPEWADLLRTWRVNSTRHQECMGALINIKMLIDSNRSQYETAAGKDKVFWANLGVRVQQTYQVYRDLYQVDLQKVLNLRDTVQAELTLAQQSRHTNKKTILLAHNIHVSKKQSAVVVKVPGLQQWNNVRSTGELLKGHLGRAYKSIALTGYQVSSSRDGDYPLPVASDSLDLQLSELGEYLLVDPRASWISQQGEMWLHSEMDVDGSLMVPKDQYDAIIFLKVSPKATNLP